MSDRAGQDEPRQSKFIKRIAARERRKLRAKRLGERSIWFGMAMSGLIGWSVAVPILGGIALGMWLDKHYPARHSWTLTLMMAGIVIGCWNAWRWVAEEGDSIEREEHNHESK